MKLPIIILTVTFFLIPAKLVFSAEESVPAATRNPFTPQLPKKIKIVEDKQKTVPENITKNPLDKAKTNDQKIQIPVAGEPKVPELPQPKFIVTGIIWNSDRPQAIINGQVVDIGDVVQEFKIESIDPLGIEVSIRGVKMTVKP